MNDYGKVFLIGAGPGDPGLLTLKGKAVLERADVVVYDRLVSPSILGFCNAQAQMVDVGKMPTHHKVKQSEINKLLVKFAKEMPGATIARLKGGDPFVFGRGGEEALELVDAGVEFEVVPGVTSAISVPAYAGIPVSHRGIATSFHVITGHEKLDEIYEMCHLRGLVELSSMRGTLAGEPPANDESSSFPPEGVHAHVSAEALSGQRSSDAAPLSSISGLDFAALAKCPGTLIFLMGISNMEMIARRLMECGKEPKTPLAFIEKGTTPYQRTVTCTLETAGETIARENVTAPAITIMGGVVELGGRIAWRRKLPLSGKRLVVTRAARQASGISSKLSALGAEVIETPMIETRSVEPRVDSRHPREGGDPASLTLANFADLANFDVLAFTSTNGVESFFDAFFKAGLDIRALAGKKIASVGKITGKKLLEYGLRCDYVPEDHTGEGLGRLLAEKCAADASCVSASHPRDLNDCQSRDISCHPREGGNLAICESRILLLQGNLADETLTTLLPEATRWIVYETLTAKTLPEWKREAVAAADAVVFASSSAVENFVKTVGVSNGENVESSTVVDSDCAISLLGERCPRACFSIGRKTTATAKQYGFEVVESDETTMDSLVKKIAEFYA